MRQVLGVGSMSGWRGMMPRPDDRPVPDSLASRVPNPARSGVGSGAGREHERVARVACLLDRRRGGDPTGRGEAIQIALRIRRGVKPLPQQRQRVRAVQWIGLDPGGAQGSLDL